MRFLAKNLFTFSLLLLALLGLSGCGEEGFDHNNDDEGTNTPSTPTQGQQTFFGPGMWELNMNYDSNTFTLKNIDITGDNNEQLFELSGSFNVANSGFTMLDINNVTKSNENNTNLDENDTILVLNASNYVVYMIPPEDQNAPFIPLVRRGSCPSGDIDETWVTVDSNAGATDTGRGFFGQFEYSVSNQEIKQTTRYSIATQDNLTSIGVNTFDSEDCENGLVKEQDTTQFLPPNGLSGVVQIGTSDTILVLESDNDSRLSSFSRNGYNGLLFDQSTSNADKNSTITADCTSTGCTIYEVNDRNAGGQGDELAKITWNEETNNPSAGFLRGVLSTENADDETFESNVFCAANSDLNNSNDNILNCIAPAPENTASRVHFVLHQDQ